jgi:hypothetical protein
MQSGDSWWMAANSRSLEFTASSGNRKADMRAHGEDAYL